LEHQKGGVDNDPEGYAVIGRLDRTHSPKPPYRFGQRIDVAAVDVGQFGGEARGAALLVAGEDVGLEATDLSREKSNGEDCDACRHCSQAWAQPGLAQLNEDKPEKLTAHRQAYWSSFPGSRRNSLTIPSIVDFTFAAGAPAFSRPARESNSNCASRASRFDIAGDTMSQLDLALSN
jgi:hypothetical protein